MAAKTNIYILRLSNNKYYVGKSGDPHKRYAEHVAGRGSAWTNKHKPIELLKIISDTSPFEEDRYTKELMAKHGIDNVRGGSYVSCELDEAQYESLSKEIWAATDCCTTCGRKGHFARNCYAKTTVDGVEIVYEYEETSDDEFEDDDDDDEFEDDDDDDYY